MGKGGDSKYFLKEIRQLDSLMEDCNEEIGFTRAEANKFDKFQK